MSRRSLRPQLNQIRGWVRQGRTDAWIAHQLEVTVQQIQAFKREHGLEPDGEASGDGAGAEEVDLRASDDEAIAAELEAEEVRRAEEEAKAAEEAARKAAEAEAAEERGRGRAEAASARAHGARRRAGASAPPGPARGHVRPRRGGLRAVARPRRPGRPRLRRALGRPPARRGHDRGGPDRDPPRRRRRGRRRLTSTASSRTCARSRTRSPSGRSRCRGARPCSTTRVPWVREVNVVRVEATASASAPATSRSRPSSASRPRPRSRCCTSRSAPRWRRRSRPPAGRSAGTC